MWALLTVLILFVGTIVSGKAQPIDSYLLKSLATHTTPTKTPTTTPFYIPTTAPTTISPQPPVKSSTVVSIISQSNNINPDGSFNFGYETENGIKVDESGFLKPNANAKAGSEDTVFQVLTGSYSYTAPDGTQINLKYLADENGFQPVGDHLPTSPPVSKEIQNALI